MKTSTCCRGPKVILCEAIGMDIGTLPWSDSHGDNYRYFLLMVDLFTRYVELQPLRDQEANSIIEAFEQGWIYRGHGMPSIVLTDKGANLDSQIFREFCQKAGVNKRRTTPYHPQCDGMAERNIGLTKQIMCLQADRHLSNGSWPKLLTEVSFHMNAIKNETSRLSPHILTYGREPRSPLDAWYDNLGSNETNSHEEYLQASKREELCGIAQENIDRNLVRVRDCYNLGKSGTDFNKGDKVVLKRNMVQDSLSAKYDGPFEVLERSGPDVKLQLAVKERWVHLNNVKKYVHVGQAQTVIGDASVTQLHNDPNEAIADTSGITEIEGVPTSAPEGTPSYNPDASMLEPSSDNDASLEKNREQKGATHVVAGCHQ